MNSDVRALVERVAGWGPTSASAHNWCSIRVGLLKDAVLELGVNDVQRIEVSGLTNGDRSPHPALAETHQVLRIGTEYADVTWMQIDDSGEVPWKVYESCEALRNDWTKISDWETGEPHC